MRLPSIAPAAGRLGLAALGWFLLAAAAAAAPAQDNSKENAGPPRTASVAGLKAVCMADSRPTGWCAGYLQGAADSIVAFSSGGHAAGLWQSQIPPAQLPGIFIGWATKNPKTADLPMQVGVHMAFGVH